EVFAFIYQKFAKNLMDYAAVRVDTFEDANDIIHDLFVQLWETRDELTITHSFKAYLYFCLKRRILNYYRKNNTRQAYADHPRLISDTYANGPVTSVLDKKLDEIVQKIIAEMPSRQREIYFLSREQHLTIREISISLKVSELTVKNQLYLATF